MNRHTFDKIIILRRYGQFLVNIRSLAVDLLTIKKDISECFEKLIGDEFDSGGFA
jgi:hypothetical protein